MTKRPAHIALFSLVFALLSCSGETPSSDRIAAAYADLLILRSMSASIDSTSYAVAVDSVLASHELTRQAFEEGMIELGGTPEEINAFFDKVNTRIGGPGTAPVDR